MKKQHFNFEEIFSFAWSKTKQHAWFLVCSFMIYSVIMSAVRLAPILDIVTALMIGLSLLSISLIIVRDESFSFADLFNKLKSPRVVINFIVLTAIYCFVVSIFTVPFIAALLVATKLFVSAGTTAVTSKLVMILVATIVSLIPAIYVAIRFKFYPFVLLENEHMNVVQIIKHTYRLTCCNFWSLLWFFIILAVLNTVGMLAFGVGLVLTVPISVFAFAHLYRKLEHHTH